LTVFGIPDEKEKKTKFAIEIPYALGIIATRSFSEELQGMDEIIEEGKGRIQQGMKAYGALKVLQKSPNDEAAKKVFEEHGKYLGYGLLLKKYTENVVDATPAQIDKAAQDLEPHVLPLFFSFRIMVACGLFFIFLFAVGFYLSTKRKLRTTTWYLRLAFWSLPLPWLAAELGWFVAEYGRQPFSEYPCSGLLRFTQFLPS